MEKFIKSAHKKSEPFRKIFFSPNLYLLNILSKVILFGFITYIIVWLQTHTSLHEITVPNTLNGLFGFVLALLLVFRTNTAYDRWWEGSKRISDITGQISTIIVFCSYKEAREFLSLLKILIRNLKVDLSNINSRNNFLLINQSLLISIFSAVDDLKIENSDKLYIKNILKDLLNNIVACERIKNTPIPFAYSAHIKVSMFIYLIILPFSIFSDLGMISVPIVMLIYFVIGGVETISNEIENPFLGDPNDLPINELFKNIETLFD